MKLKTDTFYKTRDGRKVYIYCLGNRENIFWGAFCDEPITQYWYDDGCFLPDKTESDSDLVSEWSEEPFHLEIGKRYKTRDGRIAFVAAKDFDGTLVGMIKGYSSWFWWDSNGINGEKDVNDLVECIDED